MGDQYAILLFWTDVGRKEKVYSDERVDLLIWLMTTYF